MNDKYTAQADTWYQLAEQKAAQYFETLNEQVKNKTYVTTLTEDIQLWKKNHIQHYSLLSFFREERKNRILGIIIDIYGG